MFSTGSNTPYLSSPLHITACHYDEQYDVYNQYYQQAALEQLRENFTAESEQYERAMDDIMKVLTIRQQAQVCIAAS